MPRKGHSEEQILYALRQVEGGQKVSEVCREMGVAQTAAGDSVPTNALSKDQHIPRVANRWK